MKKTFIKKGIFTCIAAILGVASSFAQTITNVAVDASACTGRTVSVTFTPTGFMAGTEFTAQLSDASGAFTSPVEIGKGTTSPVVGTIPATMSAGASYKVRVLSITPAVTAISLANLIVKSRPPAPSLGPLSYCVGQSPATVPTVVGSNIKWYMGSDPRIEISPITSVNTLATKSAAVPFAYISQTVDGCESDKNVIVMAVYDSGKTPTIINPGDICQNTLVSTDLLRSSVRSNETDAGFSTDFRWSESSNGPFSTTTPIPVTSTVGAKDYFVLSYSSRGCPSNIQKVTVTIKPTPAAPVVSNKTYIVGQKNIPALTANGTGSFYWFTQESGGVGATTGPVPSTDKAGTTSYWVTQTVDNCESPRAKLDVIVSAGACTPPAGPVVQAYYAYCVGAIAGKLTAQGTGIKWYSGDGVTLLADAPTPITTVAHNASNPSYYVSQTVNSCESERIPISIDVKATTPAPTIVAPAPICQNNINIVTSEILRQAIVSTGTNYQWYSTADGNPSTTIPSPSVATPGSTDYYVTQTNTGSCESPRSKITVTITQAPPAPTVNNRTYTVGQTNIPPLSATGTGSFFWFTQAVNGVGSTTAPTPSTLVAGTTSYYVTQTVGNCESPRAKIDVVVTAAQCTTPAAPVVITPLNYTVGQTAVLTATASTNGVLNWYGTNATGGTASTTKSVPSTATIGSMTYYVSQTVGTCESPRAAIVVNVTASTCTPPPAPTGQSLYTLCEGATPQQLTATGQNLKWYQYFEGKGQPLASAPTPSTMGPQTPTSPSYYVTQTVNGCESPRLDITVAVLRFTQTPVITNPAAVCQNSLVTSSILTNAINGYATVDYLWSDNDSVTDLGKNITPVPSTAEVGTKDYYVLQWPGHSCPSAKAKITITVKAAPAMPKTQEYFSYCVGATATKLTAEGQNLKWYGGDGTTILNTAPTPATTDAHNALTPSFYVSQTVNGCESIKAPISINVNAISPTPVVTSPAAICQNSEVTSQILLSSVPQNLSYIWYDSDGKAYPTVPTPSSATAGTKDYFVTQTNSRSCESLKAKVSVVVKPEPSSPTISKSLVEYCQGVTAAPLAATPAASGTLNWYGTSATGGSSSATAPVPSTETVGITSYYVGQTLAGCLSSRAKIDVKINVTPKPTLGTPSVAYCQGASASPLSAEGTNLKWYLTLTDTNPRTTALTPFTEKVEDYSFYVTQTGTNTCESQKAEIKVHIKPLPSATISGSNSVSPGQSTTITVNFTGDAPWSYTLSNGQTGTSSNATTQITVIPQTTTNYVVTKVSNACGEGLSNGVAVVTVLIPTITTGNPSVSQLCAGRSFTIPFQKSGDFPSGNVFTAQISTQNDITKFVSIPSVVNGSVLTASIPDTVKAGSYFIRVVSAGQGNTLPGSVSSVKMTINPLPVATITGPSNILMGQTATLNVAITGDAPWTFNLNDGAKDTLISSSVSPVAVRISPKTTTIYQITSISNTCGVGRGAGTFRVQVDPILGVEPPVPVADWLKVYPTMIENKCTVEITGTISAREALVEIVDLNGRSLSKKSIRQKITEVDFTSKPSGMYLLKVQNGDRSSVQRIFKP